MIISNFKREYCVIFLVDKPLPQRIVLLERAADKKLAPLVKTGIGGKIEKGETSLDSAYRELFEETGIKNVELLEFAECIMDNKCCLHYFVGVYLKKLPVTVEGRLYWVEKNSLLSENIAPNTKMVCKYWLENDLSFVKKFSLVVHTVGVDDLGVHVVEVDEVINKLIVD